MKLAYLTGILPIKKYKGESALNNIDEYSAVAKMIDEVHRANTSILEYNSENALSCVITLADYNAVNEYTIIQEQPTGKGYADKSE